MECRCPYCLSPVQSGAPCPACGRDWEGYQPASHHLPPGSLLQERYQLGRALGEGGFGITYLGWDTVLKRKVAVKEYFPTFLVSREVSLTLDVTCHTSGNQPTYEKGREQFLREAKTMARLDSIPEIVQVLDHFPEHNTAYIVMEFLEGRTLKEVVAQSGPIPADTMLALLEPVLRAMEAMHQAGVIHRDISPDNLMELKDGTVKLMDFGCARDFQSGLTETITLKHGFAPREQYSGRDQGPWTDVYALCATVYYCLTGKVPPRATLRGEEEQDPMIPPRQLGADLIEEQERALLRGLSPKVENRCHSAAELYAALYGRTLDGTPWTWSEEQIGQTEFVNTEENKGPTPDPIPKKPTIPAKWIKLGGAAACALVALAAVLALGLGSGGQENVLSDDSDRPQSTAGQNADQEDASQTPEEDPKPSGEDGQAGDGQLIPAISDQELEPEPAADPDQPDIEAGQTGIGGQTGSQTTPSQSTQPVSPSRPRSRRSLPFQPRGSWRLRQRLRPTTASTPWRRRRCGRWSSWAISPPHSWGHGCAVLRTTPCLTTKTPSPPPFIRNLLIWAIWTGNGAWLSATSTGTGWRKMMKKPSPSIWNWPRPTTGPESTTRWLMPTPMDGALPETRNRPFTGGTATWRQGAPPLLIQTRSGPRSSNWRAHSRRPPRRLFTRAQAPCPLLSGHTNGTGGG